jgi:hypothetical protein
MAKNEVASITAVPAIVDVFVVLGSLYYGSIAGYG